MCASMRRLKQSTEKLWQEATEMNRTLRIDYKDSTLCLQLDLPPTVSLVINDIVRDKQSATRSDPRFYLSTTLQVGYEEHELIEGRASYHSGTIEASLAANSVVLVSEIIETFAAENVDKEERLR